MDSVGSNKSRSWKSGVSWTGFWVNLTQRFQKIFCFENLAELLFVHTGILLSQEMGSDLTSSSSSVHSLAGSQAVRNSTAGSVYCFCTRAIKK